MTSLAHVFTYSHSLSVSNACKQLRSLGIASAEATRLSGPVSLVSLGLKGAVRWNALVL